MSLGKPLSSHVFSLLECGLVQMILICFVDVRVSFIPYSYFSADILLKLVVALASGAPQF